MEQTSEPGLRAKPVIVSVLIRSQGKSENYYTSTYGFDLEGWGPLVLEDVKANATELVDVGVVDLGPEEHLWRDHWVLVGQEELKVEHSSFEGSFAWASDLDVEVSAVGLGWLCVDAHDYKNRVRKHSLYSLHCQCANF